VSRGPSAAEPREPPRDRGVPAGRAVGVGPAGHRRLRLVLLVLVTLVLVLPAAPAAADPARPTHYRATVTDVVTADGQSLAAADGGALEVEVLGGDAFLVVRAAPGTTVAVPGYEDEPYLRVAADGTVEVNVRSPARWLNDARYGARDVQVPPQADAQAPPMWEVVAREGTYAWHDHRIHVMSPVLPAQVDPTAGTVQRVWDTVVPLEVDGQAAEVRIELDWLPGPAPFVAALLPLVLAAALSALLLARPAAASPVLAGVAVAALGVGVATWVATPPGGDVEPAPVVLPVLALTLVVVGRGVARRRQGGVPSPSTGRPRQPDAAVGWWWDLGAAVPVTVWGVLSSPALVRPIVPGPLSVWIVRGVTAAALSLGVAVVVVGWRILAAAPQPSAGG
jgi:hypothetical protein